MAELYGIEIGELPEGHTAVEILVIVKCFDRSADPDDIPVKVSTRSSDSLSMLDALGMVHAAKLDISKQYLESMGDG